jgi:hypothetical protein
MGCDDEGRAVPRNRTRIEPTEDGREGAPWDKEMGDAHSN